MQPKVILLNPDLTYAAPPQMLQGFSGHTYGTSRWNATYQCHTVEMSLAAYELCWQDLQKAIHLQMRRWFPRFLMPVRPAAVIEFESGYQRGCEGAELGTEVGGMRRAGWEEARRVGQEESSRPASGNEGASLPIGESEADDGRPAAGGRRARTTRVARDRTFKAPLRSAILPSETAAT